MKVQCISYEKKQKVDSMNFFPHKQVAPGNLFRMDTNAAWCMKYMFWPYSIMKTFRKF